jgi:hypothetical protein
MSAGSRVTDRFSSQKLDLGEGKALMLMSLTVVEQEKESP